MDDRDDRDGGKERERERESEKSVQSEWLDDDNECSIGMALVLNNLWSFICH